MRLGIMQPYFFPYLGHFALINAVDQWVVFDITQYTPKTWMNRNRILHPNAGWQYVTVPLSNSSISIKTSEAKVLNLQNAKQTTLAKLAHYKKKAPYFNQVFELVNRTFDNAIDDLLVNLNVSALSAVCDYLNIKFSFQICSHLNLEYPLNLKAGDWAPHICQKLGASGYVNPLGGKEIFNVADFKKREIALYFAEFSDFKYITKPYQYEPHLSVLDVMMWNSPDDIRNVLMDNISLKKCTSQLL
ncbi:WbqC family protein [Porticoccus sp. Uisw_050_02]|uniref:WbqC family protein n=1 Tax=Porticoccus sp. Uisw_050_02 TaxID=3230978 RepID=UPI0039ED632E